LFSTTEVDRNPDDVRFGFVDIAVDHRGKKWILFLFESTRTLKVSLTLNDPGVGRLFTIECLGLAVDDRPVFLDSDLGEKGFRAVFARSGAYGSHLVVVLSVGVVGRSCVAISAQPEPGKYNNVVPRARNGSK
jgi:hypothetical protein